MDTPALLAGIRQLAAPYSAPYFEAATRAALRTWLNALQLASTVDAYGNTWVRLHSGQPKQALALVAHLDHPALQVHSVRGRNAICTALGGGFPTAGLLNAPVCFPHTRHTRQGPLVGEIRGVRTRRGPKRVRLERCTVRLPSGSDLPEVGDVGVLQMPAFARRGHRLRMRSADDLAGSAAIVAALHDLRAEAGTPGVHFDVTAVFTRAEEVGLHGAVAIAHDGLLPKSTWVVSVECSPTLGGYVLGKGPVVRHGDRAGPFSPAACAMARAAAYSVDGLRFQEGAMAGGTCEATAFLAFGYTCTGVSLPLANYHNQGEASIAPEEIDLRDLQGARRLLATMCLRAGRGIDDMKYLRDDLALSSDGGRRRLRQGDEHV